MRVQPAIGDYAVIGDGRTCALVARDGVIDWLCLPRFDSEPVFGTLLDGERGGFFRVAPTGQFAAERRYLDDTNVLETTFTTATGAAVLTDLMVVVDEAARRELPIAEHEVLRRVFCRRGVVEIELHCAARPGFGRPRCIDCGALGVRIEWGRSVMYLRASTALRIDGDDVVARVRLAAGESLDASLVWATMGPAVLAPFGARTRDMIARAAECWRAWSRRTRYDGPHREAVVRSALALKLLAYAPSGAVVAAATTSLPERIGGPLNWDYRYCWLRDASFTARALFELGHVDDATAFVSWLLHSTRLTKPRLEVLYDVYGRRPPSEHTVEAAGYRGSRPVRVGNGAANQLQLDLYGEVIDALCQLVDRGGTLDRTTESVIAGFGDEVCRDWDLPDEGIWEPRGGRRRHTHSQVLCWTALDRLVDLAQKGHIRRKDPVDKWRRVRQDIATSVRSRAWSPDLASYVAWIGGHEDELDAALLLMAWYGFEDASTTRMRATWRRITERLGAGGPLLYRYGRRSIAEAARDAQKEGAFGVCSFWGAEYLALGGGTLEEARARFDALCGYANDVGLYAEEMDPSTGDALGNFPQAFTHVGLINAALTLEARAAERRCLPHHDLRQGAHP